MRKWLHSIAHAFMCKPLVHCCTTAHAPALCKPLYGGGVNTLSAEFINQSLITVQGHPSLRQSTVCACVSVPGLRNLGNEVEQSIRAVTIRRPVEHGKLQLLPSACLNEHIQLNTHINVCTTTHKHTPAISNDDLCPAWKAGMHNCNSHKHTQIHSHMHSQLNT